MRVTFQRSGGFAGMRLAVTADTDTMNAQEAQDLQRLVDSTQFFSLPEKAKAGTGTDQFTYEITVDDASRRHHVEIGESAVPETLRPLLDYLTRLARAAGRAG